jgi:hypothetical protein
MIPIGPRRLAAAVFCALLTSAPAFAAVALEVSAARPELPVLSPAAVPLSAAALAPSLSVGAPALQAAPSVFAASVLALPPSPALPAASAAAAPDEPAAAAAAAAAAPAQTPALTPAPSDGVFARARSGMRSAVVTARAVVFVAVAALTPKSAAALPTEGFLRETQEYAPTSRRASLSDGAIVEARERAPYRVSLSHPGLASFLSAAGDAAKTPGQDERGRLDAVRSVVRAALPRAADVALKAAELRSWRERKAVELGVYAERGRGGSEESALLANLALTRAGFTPKLARVAAWRVEPFGIVDEERTLNLVHTSAGQVVFDPSDAAFDGAKLQDLTAPRGAPGRRAGIAEELDGPKVFTPAGKPKTSGVEAKVSGDRELTFAAVGRSAADRLFKEDEKAYQDAAPDQPVTVEWLYFPFYMDGHTALRIGDKIFEFRRKGWRTSPARAFLFNNPFFNAQIERHPHLEMPPFTFGTPLSVRKSEVAAFVAKVSAMEDAGRGWFSFWFNNCNQVPFRFLKKAGVDLIGGIHTRFSSIRSYRMILLHPPAGAGAPRIYPLPNQNGVGEPLGAAVPRYLVEERNSVRDILYFLWTWPQFVREKLPHRGAPKS